MDAVANHLYHPHHLIHSQSTLVIIRSWILNHSRPHCVMSHCLESWVAHCRTLHFADLELRRWSFFDILSGNDLEQKGRGSRQYIANGRSFWFAQWRSKSGKPIPPQPQTMKPPVAKGSTKKHKNFSDLSELKSSKASGKHGKTIYSVCTVKLCQAAKDFCVATSCCTKNDTNQVPDSLLANQVENHVLTHPSNFPFAHGL